MENNWIKIEDQKPDPFAPVLLLDSINGTTYRGHYRTEHETEQWHVIQEHIPGFTLARKFEYWMPMPDHPKEFIPEIILDGGVKSQRDYEYALNKIDMWFDEVKPGHPMFKKIKKLVEHVAEYEEKHHKIDPPEEK